MDAIAFAFMNHDKGHVSPSIIKVTSESACPERTHQPLLPGDPYLSLERETELQISSPYHSDQRHKLHLLDWAVKFFGLMKIAKQKKKKKSFTHPSFIT